MRIKIALLCSSALVVLSMGVAQAQFVAFNDHYAGPTTHPNATTWNVFGTDLGAPGSSGPLKDIVTGSPLSVILTITNFNAGPNTTSSAPDPGSAAYNIFNGYVDFSSSTMYSMIRLEAPLSASVGHVLSSLDPTKRYSVKLTAVRGNNYFDRWALMELSGAVSFNTAHTAGSYTNGLSLNQVAINTGENRADGATAIWTDIDPGPDGVIAIVSRQYVGPLPGGGSGSTGTYGYAPVALRVEEFGSGPSPAHITAQPTKQQQLFEGATLQLSVSVAGSAPITVQWFKDNAPTPIATGLTLTFPNAVITNSGTYFAKAANTFGGETSSNAVVTVLGKQTPALPLLEFTNVWRFNQAGVDLGSGWRQPLYNDSSWSPGRGIFSYANYVVSYPEAINTPLAQTNGLGNSILTYYFRTHFNFPTSSKNVLLIFSNLLDDGAVFYLNNTELMRIRLPSGALGYATLADASPSSGTLYETTNVVGLPLLAGDNVLAVELHQFVPSSTDAVFGMNLRAYAFPSEPLVILDQPASRVAIEQESVVFQADLFGGGNVFYHWFKDGVALPNATNRTLILPEVRDPDHGLYSFLASNAVNTVTSSNAQLTVIPDTIPPRLIAAYFTNNLDTVVLQFSEAVDVDSAMDPNAYTFLPTLAVTGVALESPSAVRLTVAGMNPQFGYYLAVTGVDDRATIPNEIDPGSSIQVVVTPVNGSAMLAVQTVFVIVMENHDWSTIIGNPYCPYINNVLLPMASYANQFYTPNDLHPSEPNYIWMEAGSNFGILDDSEPSVNHLSTTNHLTTLLRHAGISWKTYQENIPGDTCPVISQYPYAAKHNPFVFFDDITSDFNYCLDHIRPFEELATDLANHTVAHYNFITPNLTNDMHDYAPGSFSSEGQGDYWLSQQMPMILNSAAYANNGAVFITWDEGSPAGPIGMIVLSPLARGGGYNNNIHYTHSSLLRSLQETFRVGPLLGGAASAASLSDLFTSLSLSAVITNGQLALRLDGGQPSKTYYVQASSDLRNWTSISTNVATSSSILIAPSAANHLHQFYRAIQGR